MYLISRIDLGKENQTLAKNKKNVFMFPYAFYIYNIFILHMQRYTTSYHIKNSTVYILNIYIREHNIVFKCVRQYYFRLLQFRLYVCYFCSCKIYIFTQSHPSYSNFHIFIRMFNLPLLAKVELLKYYVFDINIG